MYVESTAIKVEAGVSAGLLTTPLWVIILNDVSWVAGVVASICGAIVGLHAVYRILKNWRNNRTKHVG